jgi:hypothetical protein
MSIEQSFWVWFVQHCEDYKNPNEHELDTLAHKLEEVDKHLVFEINFLTNLTELVISAGGIKAAFDAVHKLRDIR